MNNHFKGKQYDYRIIIEVIGLYYHFSLSYRECAKTMGKFSIGVDHTTIYRWNKQCGINVENYLNPGELIKPMSK